MAEVQRVRGAQCEMAPWRSLEARPWVRLQASHSSHRKLLKDFIKEREVIGSGLHFDRLTLAPMLRKTFRETSSGIKRPVREPLE